MSKSVKDVQKELQKQVQWIRQKTKYQKMNDKQIQQENKKVLNTLKYIQGLLDKQLENQKIQIVNQNFVQHQADQYKIVLQNIKNNENYIKVLEKQMKKIKNRREQLKNGLQSKLNTNKYQLQNKVAQLKAQLKKMKLQENQLNKRLANRQNDTQPESLQEHLRLEEELRIYSIKYVKILEKFNRITEKLAISSNTQSPNVFIPQQIYDQELEERQQAQFKQYQGIVKMCTILSKRNDSQTNKSNRIYTQKLKELEKIIINLGQIDRMIALRQGQIIEGKKNLQVIKFKFGNNEKMQDHQLSLSQSNLRKASYSTSKLTEGKYFRQKQFSQGTIITKKLARVS